MSNTMLPRGSWLLPNYEPERVSDPDRVHIEVWVHLELLCPRPADDRRRVMVDGVDFTTKAPGVLTHWLRTGDGGWLGLVTYEVAYVDGRHYKRKFEDQLLPAWAPSQRDAAPETEEAASGRS